MTAATTLHPAVADTSDEIAKALAAAGLGLWFWNVSSQTFDVNDSTRIALGYEQGDAEWHGPVDLFALAHPAGVDVMRDELAMHLEGFWPFNLECRLMTGHGQYRWFQLSGKLCNGRVVGTIADISARRELQERVAASEARFRSLFEQSPLPTIVTEASHVELGNPAWDSLVGGTVTRFEAPASALEQLKDHATYATVRVELERPGLGTVTVEARGTAMTRTRVVHILEDVTPRLDAEKREQQLQKKLLASSRLAGMAEMATGVLHNIGNSLNSAVTSTVVAKRLVDDSAASQNLEKLARFLQRDDLASALSNGDKAAKLGAFAMQLVEEHASSGQRLRTEIERVSDVLEHTCTIVSAQQSMARFTGVMVDTVNLQELIGSVLELASTQRNTGGVEVTVDVPQTAQLRLDRVRVSQILVNFVVNAVEAMGDAGTPALGIKTYEEAGYCVFAVTDSGIGMTAETVAKLFQHGFTTKKTGHGFGLHNSAVLANEMGGRVWATSDGPGLGSTFHLSLPMDSGADA